MRQTKFKSIASLISGDDRDYIKDNLKSYYTHLENLQFDSAKQLIQGANLPAPWASLIGPLTVLSGCESHYYSLSFVAEAKTNVKSSKQNIKTSYLRAFASLSQALTQELDRFPKREGVPTFPANSPSINSSVSSSTTNSSSSSNDFRSKSNAKLGYSSSSHFNEAHPSTNYVSSLVKQSCDLITCRLKMMAIYTTLYSTTQNFSSSGSSTTSPTKDNTAGISPPSKLTNLDQNPNATLPLDYEELFKTAAKLHDRYGTSLTHPLLTKIKQTLLSEIYILQLLLSAQVGLSRFQYKEVVFTMFQCKVELEDWIRDFNGEPKRTKTISPIHSTSPSPSNSVDGIPNSEDDNIKKNSNSNKSSSISLLSTASSFNISSSTATQSPASERSFGLEHNNNNSNPSITHLINIKSSGGSRSTNIKKQESSSNSRDGTVDEKSNVPVFRWLREFYTATTHKVVLYFYSIFKTIQENGANNSVNNGSSSNNSNNMRGKTILGSPSGSEMGLFPGFRMQMDYCGMIESFAMKTSAISVSLIYEIQHSKTCMTGYSVPVSHRSPFSSPRMMNHNNNNNNNNNNETGIKEEDLEEEGFEDSEEEEEEDKAPTGLSCWPAIFNVPGPPLLQHWPNLLMIISNKLEMLNKYGKDPLCFYDSGINCTYFVIKVDPQVYLTAFFKDKQKSNDLTIVGTLSLIANHLRNTIVFTKLKSPPTNSK